MRLLNADGSRSEMSGNGVRCLAAWLARSADAARAPRRCRDRGGRQAAGAAGRHGAATRFAPRWGSRSRSSARRLDVDGAPVDAITLPRGQPAVRRARRGQQERLHTVAAALAVHPHFPAGTNVELARRSSRPVGCRILIWERGVGPTEASGTGACAAAVAAITLRRRRARRRGGRRRAARSVSSGATMGLFLTGWAEVIAEAALASGSPARVMRKRPRGGGVDRGLLAGRGAVQPRGGTASASLPARCVSALCSSRRCPFRRRRTGWPRSSR